MQKAYLTALFELAQKDERVVSLLADSGTAYDELFRRYLPQQIIDFGIAEEHLVAAAAGMASVGKIPFAYTAGAFLAYRSFEFIRDDVCFQNQNVKIVGMGSGLAWCTLGPSHHTTEDCSVLRALPNLTIFSPASPLEVKKSVQAAYDITGPVYIRIGMSGEEELYSADYDFLPGKSVVMAEGDDIAIFSTGTLVAEVLKAAALLREQGIHARVINVHTLKPFDTEGVLSAAKSTKHIFTAEEHNIYGGLGSMVAEVLAEHACAVSLTRIGLPDCFAKGYGTLAQVRQQNGLDAQSIAQSVLAVLP